MWAVRKPCLYDDDKDYVDQLRLHDKIHIVEMIDKVMDGIKLIGLDWYILSRFLLFNTKEEAESVFQKIQGVRNCMQ